jgi:hypothetical protein
MEPALNSIVIYTATFVELQKISPTAAAWAGKRETFFGTNLAYFRTQRARR